MAPRLRAVIGVTLLLAGQAAAALGALWMLAATAPAAAEMVMFSQRNFQGSGYALVAAGNSMSFSPRSVRVLPDQPWELCPRPFFGGACITVTEAEPKLNLPRGFSGMVRSARPAARPEGGIGDKVPDGEPKP